jgi:hypothetical protein
MSQRSDDSERLASLLRALPAAEPSAEFRAVARRRYLAAIEARDRRAVLTALMAALIGLGIITMLLGPSLEPTAPVAWLAEAAADLARWATGIGVVLALVPPIVWMSVGLGFAGTVLSLLLAVRARSLALAK